MISIILDESGTLSINNKDKYFVIAGYMCKDIRKIKFIHKKVSNNFRTKLKNKIEIKAKDLQPEEKAIFINELLTLNDIKLIGIYINAKNQNLLKNLDNVIDKYNILIRIMLDKVYENCKEYFDNENEINFKLDERKDKGKMKYGLELYLKNNWKLCKISNNFKLSIKYLDSKNNLDIQMADYIANIIFVKTNYPSHRQAINFINNWESNNKLIWNYEDYHNRFNLNQDILKIRKNTIVTHTNLINIKNLNKIENFKRQSNNETIENFYQKNNFWTLTHYKKGKILIQGKEIIELIEILNIEI